MCIVGRVVAPYLLPAKTAAALFPLLALLLFLPTAVVLYRRHGVMSRGRVLSLLGFLYYAVTALCMTVVPLPERTADMCRRFAPVARPQLTPGNTVGDVWKEAHHKVAFDALVLGNPAVTGALLNLVLLLPLGVFVRCHLRRGAAVAAVAGFGASLFFELTQGTGLWGVYPCPYRLFDVDDLLINTAGALLGWWAAGPFVRLLPAPDGTPQHRRPVTVGRRLVALVVDLAGSAAVTAVALLVLMYDGHGGSELLTPVTLATLVLWFVVLPRLYGATPGKRLLLLRLVTAHGGGPPPLWRLAVRAALLGVVTLPLVATLVAAALILLERPSLPLGRAAGMDPHNLYWLLAGHLPQFLMLLLVTGWIGAYLLLARHGASALWPHERASGLRVEPLRRPATPRNGGARERVREPEREYAASGHR